MKYLTFCAYLLTVPAANWLIGNVGVTCVDKGPCLVPVGFGLVAPSGVMMIGLALVLRDLVQEQLGAKWALGAIGLGCALSLVTSPAHLAIASAAAFGFAEFIDWAVYSRIRAKGRAAAVFLSGVVGAAVDSALFVYLAFGSFDLSAGTTLAKIYASALFGVWLMVRGRK